MLRIGVIGIVVEGNRDTVEEVQGILSDYYDIIVGRMGVPDRKSGVSVISVIVKGTNEQISALTGKLGKINNISVKSALTKVELYE